MNIDRNQFLDRFQSGIELSDALERQVPSVRSLDTNQDQLVQGDELSALYAHLNPQHEANLLLELDRAAPPANRLVQIARGFKSDDRLAQGYRPSELMLSTNRMHGGRRRPDGLVTTRYQDVFKCNLFIGDVLEQAGLRTPKVSNRDQGWVHFAYAEDWRKSGLFREVERQEVRPGDIIAVDYPDERGAGGGHLEIVTDTSDGVRSIGVRYAADAIVEDKVKGDGLSRSIPRSEGGYFDPEHEVVYRVLRHVDLPN